MIFKFSNVAINLKLLSKENVVIIKERRRYKKAQSSNLTQLRKSKRDLGGRILELASKK